MAKKIRFPLKMKNGAEVRTLDELKENFNLESVLGYFTDGRLYTWLTDRYYDEKAEAVSALSAETPDLNAKLCNIFEVEYQAEHDETDVELIAKHREKLSRLSTVTDNSDALNNIELVAESQDELFEILDEHPERVYLYGDKFSIPMGATNIRYVGINTPLIILENGKFIDDYNSCKIVFDNVRFEEGISDCGETLFLAGRHKEAFPIIEKAANNGNPRAMYLLALYYDGGYNVVKIDKTKRNKMCKKAFSCKETLSRFGYGLWCTSVTNERKTIFESILNDIRALAESSDAFAQEILGYMYDNGFLVSKDTNTSPVHGILEKANSLKIGKKTAAEWYTKSAEQGNASAQYYLGYMYENGYGVEQDMTKAFEWYKKSAEQGYNNAQLKLGEMYQFGNGIRRNCANADEWFKKAAAQNKN